MEETLSFNDLPNRMGLALVLSIGLARIAFTLIIEPFLIQPLSGAIDGDYGSLLVTLSPEETLAVFERIGLSRFVNFHSLFGLLGSYMCYLGTFREALSLNYATLDPGVLMQLLNTLKSLVQIHELAFGVLNKFLEVYSDLGVDTSLNCDAFIEL